MTDAPSYLALSAALGFAGYQVKQTNPYYPIALRANKQSGCCSLPSYLPSPLSPRSSQIWNATVQHLELDVVAHKDYRPQDGESCQCCSWKVIRVVREIWSCPKKNLLSFSSSFPSLILFSVIFVPRFRFARCRGSLVFFWTCLATVTAFLVRCLATVFFLMVFFGPFLNLSRSHL